MATSGTQERRDAVEGTALVRIVDLARARAVALQLTNADERDLVDVSNGDQFGGLRGRSCRPTR